jgi:hypothetical protein
MARLPLRRTLPHAQEGCLHQILRISSNAAPAEKVQKGTLMATHQLGKGLAVTLTGARHQHPVITFRSGCRIHLHACAA